MRLLIALWCLFLAASGASAQTAPPTGPQVMSDLTLSQTSTAETLVDTFLSAFTVDISEASTSHCVWVMETSTTCTDITATSGKRLCRKAGEPDPPGWEFEAEIYRGPICVIAEDTGVVLKRSRR